MSSTPTILLRFPFICLGWMLALATACDQYLPPAVAFADTQTPPDYSLASHWSCLPEKADEADHAPDVASPDNQGEAMADVFFIHPTTFMEADSVWNASLADSALNLSTDERAIRHQASIFNRAGRVFAPRYRQMVYGGFVTTDEEAKRKALELAYSDVRAAFAYYLEHWNQGRPIIIAGHSQGALHGMLLLSEFFDGKPLQAQLVAAYLPGWPIAKDRYSQLKPCETPEETGCVASWCTFREGYEPPSLNSYYQNAIVVNPVNWTADGSPSDKAAHRGFLMGNYKTVKTQALVARQHEGILWVTSPVPLVRIKNFHVGDFNLFWLDVRENAELRVNAFVREK